VRDDDDIAGGEPRRGQALGSGHQQRREVVPGVDLR
jgi:hypothetical protein